MTGNGLDHFVITPSQVELDRRILPQTVGFVVTSLLVLHLLFDRTHFFSDDAITDGLPFGIGYDRALTTLATAQMLPESVCQRDPKRFVGLPLREIEPVIGKMSPLHFDDIADALACSDAKLVDKPRPL